MNKFCVDCSHQKIPTEIKSKFYPPFGDFFKTTCPLNDKDISGCTVKQIQIDWKGFFSFLEEKRGLKDGERAVLAKKGWKGKDRD